MQYAIWVMLGVRATGSTSLSDRRRFDRPLALSAEVVGDHRQRVVEGASLCRRQTAQHVLLDMGHVSVHGADDALSLRGEAGGEGGPRRPGGAAVGGGRGLGVLGGLR